MNKAIQRFKEKFIYKRNGQWTRVIDGYEDENGKFISNPNEAYAVPEFIEAFIIEELERVREETIKEIKDKYDKEYQRLADWWFCKEVKKGE